MKKTLILMFAAACSAMAADYTEVTETGTALDMQNFSDDYLHGTNSLATTANFTLVFSVDFSGMLNNNTNNTELLTIEGTSIYNNNNRTYKTGVGFNDTSADQDNANIYCTTSTSKTYTFPANADYYSMTLSCYELNDKTTYLISTLYAWTIQADGTLEKKSTSTHSSNWSYTSYDKTSVTLNFNTDLIDSVRVYNSVLEGTDAENAAKAVLGFTPGDGNVPEPTTATLSLMALAALAARRRRK